MVLDVVPRCAAFATFALSLMLPLTAHGQGRHGRLFDPGTSMTSRAAKAPTELDQAAFLIGEWDVSRTRTRGDGEPTAIRGVASVTYMNRGHGVMERFFTEDADGEGHPSHELRLLVFNPGGGVWSYGEASSGTESTRAMHGPPTPGRIVLHDAVRPGGGPTPRPAPDAAATDSAAASKGHPEGWPDEDCRGVESERFVFHSDPWINLHHFLFQWARDASPRRSGDRRRAVEVPEQAELAGLEEAEQLTWERGVDFYGERLVAGDLLFDRNLVALRERLAAVGCSATGPEGIDPELGTVLAEAMAVYRRHWWPGHHAANETWIRSQQQRLTSYETAFSGRLARAYGGEWPSERIRVDVAAYSNWAGAYTTNHPDHVTVSSTSYEGLEGLEILFHEVSHASFFEQKILGQLAAAFRRYGTEPPDRLSHVIQFVTPAEILRSLLSVEERSRVQFVADGMARRSRSREDYRVVLEHWKPFLEGSRERAEALDGIAAELVR